MPNVNPDPHRHGYVFVPRNRVTAVFSSDTDARAAIAELRTLEIDI